MGGVGQPNPTRLNRVDSADVFTDCELLADQSSIGAVLNFTFTRNMHLIMVHCAGNPARASVNASTPTATLGIYCDQDVITPIPFFLSAGTQLKVYAPAGTPVRVWGFAYT